MNLTRNSVSNIKDFNATKDNNNNSFILVTPNTMTNKI